MTGEVTTGSQNADSRYHLAGVSRGLDVLLCFNERTPDLRLTDISQQLGIPKVQALRILATLESRDFITRDPETKRYRLGMQLFHLGMLVQQQMDLRRIAHPYLQRLVEELQETARLVVPNDAGPICVDLVESSRRTRVFAQLGMSMPWHAGTSPKLLLAYLPEEAQERIIAACPFTRYTALTTTNVDELHAELAAIRARGYHVGVGDLDDDAAGISGPVFDHRGRIIGSLNIAGPISRLTEPTIERIVPAVCDAAARVSAELGYRAPLPAGGEEGSASHDG